MRWFLCLAALAGAGFAQTEAPDLNLALGKSYTVETPYPDPLWLSSQKSWPDTNGVELTDGVFGSPTFMSPFTGYLRGDKRIVVVDLGAEVTVRRAAASFFQNKGWGVYFPESVTFHLSSDLKKWALLGVAPSEIPASAAGALLQRFEVAGFNYAGRYLRVEIPTGVWVFIDEIEAWGQPGVAAGAVWPEGDRIDVKPIGYPKPLKTETGKARQQVLIYNGYYAPDNRIPTWTEADFKPYVTYVDQQGASRDAMFDSFLFIPIAKAPSGRDYGPGAGPSNKADWEFYLDQTFDPVNQLRALDRAVATAREDLRDLPQDPERPKAAAVVLTIPFASPLQADFGDVDGDGVSENFNHEKVGAEAAAANRVAAVKWYVDEALARWQAAQFQHLELMGFYWYGESVKYNMSPVEEQVMAEAIAYVHQKGLRVNWIPMKDGEGFRHWERLGFDVVNMQPNYMFQNVTVERLPLTAALARQYGMGIEVELDDRILRADAAGVAARAKFLDYLNYGVREGYVHGFTNWYQQVKTLLKASQSTDPEVRRMYDLTYQWIQGLYPAPE